MTHFKGERRNRTGRVRDKKNVRKREVGRFGEMKERNKGRSRKQGYLACLCV